MFVTCYIHYDKIEFYEKGYRVDVYSKPPNEKGDYLQISVPVKEVVMCYHSYSNKLCNMDIQKGGKRK